MTIKPGILVDPLDGTASITFYVDGTVLAVFDYAVATGLVAIPERTVVTDVPLADVMEFNAFNRTWLGLIAKVFGLPAIVRGPLAIETEKDGSKFTYKGRVAGLLLYHSVFTKSTGLVTLNPRRAASVTLAQLKEFIDGNAFGHVEAAKL